MVYVSCYIRPAPLHINWINMYPFIDIHASWWLRWLRIHSQCRRHRFNLWIRKILWRREWQPTPVFLPGESQGQRSLAGYSPWGCKELDMTESLSIYIYTHIRTHTHTRIYLLACNILFFLQKHEHFGNL